MAASYPRELRERVVAAYEAGTGTYAQIAERFCVGVASVSRWLGRKRRQGNVEPSALGRRRRYVDAQGEERLAALVRESPDATLRQLVEGYVQRGGRTMSVMTMWFTLRRMGYTRKKRRLCRANATAMRRA
jgi:transposase